MGAEAEVVNQAGERVEDGRAWHPVSRPNPASVDLETGMFLPLICIVSVPRSELFTLTRGAAVWHRDPAWTCDPDCSRRHMPEPVPPG